jgi:hypothetical protein
MPNQSPEPTDTVVTPAADVGYGPVTLKINELGECVAVMWQRFRENGSFEL